MKERMESKVGSKTLGIWKTNSPSEPVTMPKGKLF